MSKMGSHCPFGHLKHKLWPKERPGVKLAIWLSTTKSRESTRLPCVQGTCDIPLESSWQRLQLFLELIAIEGLHKKLCALKVVEIPSVTILGLPSGSPGTKSHLDVAPLGRRRVYYGGRWWFPSSPGRGESCVSELLVACLSTKSAPTMH
jgi:hypothetical protein